MIAEINRVLITTAGLCSDGARGHSWKPGRSGGLSQKLGKGERPLHFLVFCSLLSKRNRRLSACSGIVRRQTLSPNLKPFPPFSLRFTNNFCFSTCRRLMNLSLSGTLAPELGQLKHMEIL